MDNISANCLDLSRRTLESRMVDSAYIITNSGGGSSSLGGRGGSWVVGTVPIKCRAIGSRETEESQGGKVTAVILTDFTFPWNTPITAANRIRYKGKDYEVTGTNEDQTDRTSLLVTTRRL